MSDRLIAQGYFQCNPTLETYNSSFCAPILVASIRQLNTSQYLDTKTDIDGPTSGKIVDAELCKDSSF